MATSSRRPPRDVIRYIAPAYSIRKGLAIHPSLHGKCLIARPDPFYGHLLRIKVITFCAKNLASSLAGFQCADSLPPSSSLLIDSDLDILAGREPTCRLTAFCKGLIPRNAS